MKKKFFIGLILLYVCTQTSLGLSQIELPDLGNPSNIYMSKMDEPAIGRTYFRTMRRQGQVVEDPLLQEYIQNLGEKLSSKVQEGDYSFHYFFVPENSINAFAMPGGFIGIHLGLVTNSDNESQLASVLSHEISHVTQRHIARQIGDNMPNSIQGGLVLLGAVLLSAISGSSEILEAGTMIAPSLMAQGQIDFTREMEIEADAIGIKTLVSSGYDPYAMAEMFNKLSLDGDPRNAAATEFLRTHPTSVNRAASALKQARKLTVKRIPDSLGFELTKARIQNIYGTSTPEKTNQYFEIKTSGLKIEKNSLTNEQIGNLYGWALSLTELGQLQEAEKILKFLINTYEEYNHFHLAYTELLTRQGLYKDAINYIKEIMMLSPRNIPITMGYSLVELNYGDPKKAHEVLLDLFNSVPPSPSQIMLIAKTANAAEDYADSFSYMAEYYLSIGLFKEATEQLRLGLSVESIDDIKKAKFFARLQEIEEFIEESSKR
ncbi:MAG: hypothetical protein CMD78_04545 [Gammaproteobacteria bacterium]|nr:hypothetical protein [Gammaproteobacteria bacterium]|tara:strand:- start:4029 stop:5498 length:1470 start_codon:yes stop_codon:yes gene_type:complete